MPRFLSLALAVAFAGACQETPTGSERILPPSGDVVTADADGFAAGPVPPAISGPPVRFSVAASGEDVVLPAAYATKMGELNNTFPHAFANMRYQQVFLGSEIGGPRSFRELCLRFDDVFGGPAGVQQITLKLGPTNLDHTNLGTSFAGNYSAPPTTVFAGDLNIPASSGGGNVNSFNICIPFSTIFSYVGGNLIVEMINTSAVSLVHFDDFCSSNAADCTTTRAWAFSASAATATALVRNQGLVMKLDGAPMEGCGPRFWRTHLRRWQWAGFHPGDDFDATFGTDFFDEGVTLRRVIRRRGRVGVEFIARVGTAALLNAGHPEVDYPLSVAEVIAAVQTRERAEAVRLAGFNEVGCPFGSR